MTRTFDQTYEIIPGPSAEEFQSYAQRVVLERLSYWQTWARRGALGMINTGDRE